jgi:DNA-binding MarR family transcriptional regulator
VTRERSTSDGRLVIVRLTTAGKRLMKKLFPLFNAEEQHVVSALPRQELPAAAEILRKMTRTASGD